MAKATETIVVSLMGAQELMTFEAATVSLKADGRVVELLDGSGGVVAMFPVERLFALWRKDSDKGSP